MNPSLDFCDRAVWRRKWQTRMEVEVALFPLSWFAGKPLPGNEYINGFYNPRRTHSALGWKSLVALERKAASHVHLTRTEPGQVQSLLVTKGIVPGRTVL